MSCPEQQVIFYSLLQSDTVLVFGQLLQTALTFKYTVSPSKVDVLKDTEGWHFVGWGRKHTQGLNTLLGNAQNFS